MAQSGIQRIDDLYAGLSTATAIGPGDPDREAVGAAQDLLRGHGFRRMPGLRDAARGNFGKQTQKAVRAFRKAHGLPAGPSDVTVDSPTLVALVDEPAETPIASRVYVTQVLDRQFSPWIKMVSLVSIVEGAGKFASLNLNKDRAGLSLGIIQWAQKPKRLHEVLAAFDAAQHDLLVDYCGSAANVTGMLTHANKANGGVNADGTTTDAHYDFIRSPWKSRFEEICLDTDMQVVQLDTAVGDFQASYALFSAYATQLTSERGVGFMLDLSNQHGDGGAQSIYNAVVVPADTAAEAMRKMADESVARLTAQFPNTPSIPAAGRDRRDFFRTSPLLSDNPFHP